MRKATLIATLMMAAICSSCTSSLYYWGSSKSTKPGDWAYEKATYNYYNKHTNESLYDLLVVYEDMVSNPGGDRNMVPPGICAEYGYLLLLPETPAIVAEQASSRQLKRMGLNNGPESYYEKGIALLKKEIELYPEAEKFIAPLLKKLSNR